MKEEYSSGQFECVGYWSRVILDKNHILPSEESHGSCLILTVHYCVQKPRCAWTWKKKKIEKKKKRDFFFVKMKYQCLKLFIEVQILK